MFFNIFQKGVTFIFMIFVIVKAKKSSESQLSGKGVHKSDYG
jgi:hypothetical protein